VLRDVLGMTGTKFGCGYTCACTVHVGGAATRSCIAKVDSIGESAITTSVRLAARTGDGPELIGPYPILTAMINRLSLSDPLRHFGAAQSVGPFCAKADIERLTEPAASVEICLSYQNCL
jgi:hypothetical protein